MSRAVVVEGREKGKVVINVNVGYRSKSVWKDLGKWLLVAIAFLIMIKMPPFILVLLGIALVYALKGLPSKAKASSTSLAKSVKPLKVEVPRKLVKIDLVRDAEVYLAADKSPYVILIRGLNVIGVGALALKRVSEGGSISKVISSAYRSGTELTYIVSCMPKGDKMDLNVLFMVKVRRIALRITPSLIEDIAEDLVKRLESLREAFISHFDNAVLEPLSGEELIQVLQEVIGIG